MTTETTLLLGKPLTKEPEILAGWVQGIKTVISKHYNKRPKSEISLLVIHNISLPPAKFGNEFVERFFVGSLPRKADPYFEQIYTMEVSSHFFIKRSGAVVQFVSCLDRAWHAGKSFFEGREACNDFAIGIELEGTDTENFTDDQYESLKWLTKTLMHNYPQITLDRITGHSDIAPGRKTDPGACFDWERYKKSLG